MLRLPALPLGRTFLILLVIMLAVFAGAAAAAVLSARDAVARVESASSRLARPIDISDRLLTSMLQQEAAVRSYAESGDMRARQQFVEAYAVFGRTINEATLLRELNDVSRPLVRQQRLSGEMWHSRVGQVQVNLKDRALRGDTEAATRLDESLSRPLGPRLLDEFRDANSEFRGHFEQRREELTSTEQRTVRRNGMLVVAAIVVAAVAGVGALLFVRHGVQSPIDRLTDAAGAVREGRLDTRVPVAGAREIQVLSSTFNEMVAAMDVAEQERARLEQLKTDFISVVSHELRTPLTSIKGYTELVLDGDAGDLTDDQREYLSVAMSNTDRLVDLVNDLLDLSRIESGRFELEREPLDFNDVVEEALRVVRPLVAGKQQHLVVELAREAPSILGDRRRLVQVVLNLLSNAQKYTPDGGRIMVQTSRDGDAALLVISDNGIGMRPEDQAHVFERFYRVRSAGARDVSGTGLGLAITRSIVDLHGGRIGVQSVEGVGSRFEVRLPVALVPAAAGQVAVGMA